VNGYARSKAEAEIRLRDAEVVIARPSVVVGHTTLGVAPSSSLFWYYRALAALGKGPFDLASRRDVVPVDYVAEALELLLDVPRPRHRVYHVSAGASASVPWAVMRARLDPTPTWRTVSAAELAEMGTEIRRLARTDDEAARLARGLLACARFGALAVDYFDNARLLAEGLRAPPPFTDYLEVCRRTTGARTIHEQMIDDA
jgi:nucleoside-diphosphate-sugar epimerase